MKKKKKNVSKRNKNFPLPKKTRPSYTITITPYQSWPIRSEDFQEGDLTGRIIEGILNQVFHPRCQPNGNVETTLEHCVCILRVRVTASDKTCIRLFSRVRSWIRGVACVHKFVPAWCAGGTREGGCGWDSWPRVRVSVCACIEVGVRGNGKGSRGTITEPRFRATTRRHPFNLHPLPCSKPTGNPPLLLHLLLFFASSSSRLTCRGITAASCQTDKDVN